MDRRGSSRTGTWTVTVAAGVVSVLIACDSEEKSPLRLEDAPAEVATLGIVPGDRESSVDPAIAPGLVMHWNTVAVHAGIQAQLEAGVVLTSWPRMNPIPHAVETSETYSEDDGLVTEVRLIPNQPLPAGWYAVGVSSLPSGIAFDESAANLQGLGVGGTFRVGSEPVVKRIYFCDDQTESGEWYTGISVQFSEAVVLTEPATEYVSAGYDCVAGDGQQGVIASRIFVRCPQRSWEGQTVVEVLAGLQAESGLPVPPGVYSFAPSSLPGFEDLCAAFRPPG